MDFTFSESTQRYRDASGRFVSQAEINNGVERVLATAREHVVSLTEQLQQGSMTLDAWQAAMVAELKPLHLGAAMIGRGGRAQMDASDWGWTGQRLRAQYGYLRNFAQEIATGKAALDGRLLSRAGMYVEAARSTQREMIRRTGRRMGRSQERNQLGAADRHCSQCVDCTARGWVPIGSLPAVGARICVSRCHCVIVTRAA